jgi:hypothetical protein
MRTTRAADGTTREKKDNDDARRTLRSHLRAGASDGITSEPTPLGTQPIWFSPQAEALYSEVGLTDPIYCPVCLRAASGERPESEGGFRTDDGSGRIYCSVQHQRRAADKKRDRPGVWSRCVICRTGFMVLVSSKCHQAERRLICGPAWPANPNSFKESPCYQEFSERARATATDHQRTLRAARELEMRTALNIRAVVVRKSLALDEDYAAVLPTIPVLTARHLSFLIVSAAAHLAECSRDRGRCSIEKWRYAHRFRDAIAQAQAGERVTQPPPSLRRTNEQILADRAARDQARADRKAFRGKAAASRAEALLAAIAARRPRRRHR